MGVFGWVKNHKLVVVLILAVFYLLFRNYFYFPSVYNSRSGVESYGSVSTGMFSPLADVKNVGVRQFAVDQAVPSVADNRKLIQETNMSLLVKDVRGVGEQIVKYTESKNGFMVQSYYSKPDESPFSSIIIRVPTKVLPEAISYFRGLAVKVSSENVMGTDVTDQYVNIQERLDTLQKTKAKFEEILSKATQVQDILTVQQNLISVQEQIDSLVGQQKAIDKNVELTRITVYLSTDELSLPYVSDKAFRPTLIFKQAVRSMVETLRGLGSLGIWLGVYSVIWVPVIVGIILFKKRQKSMSSKKPVV